jgi:hypothetical protein
MHTADGLMSEYRIEAGGALSVDGVDGDTASSHTVRRTLAQR